MWHMFYGSFGTQNSMVTFIFKLDPRKGKLQAKLGQIRSNFKIQNFLTKVYLSCTSFVSGFQKCHLFLCTTNRNAKNCISKMWRHHLYLFFFCHCTAKNKDIALKFCFHVVCIYFDNIYSVFWYLENFEFYRQLFLKNRSFEFGGSK